MLGINQTIMYAPFVVVIAAFIGTTDLGQEVFRSQGGQQRGQVAGRRPLHRLLSPIADRPINCRARERKKVLGLE